MVGVSHLWSYQGRELSPKRLFLSAIISLPNLAVMPRNSSPAPTHISMFSLLLHPTDSPTPPGGLNSSHPMLTADRCRPHRPRCTVVDLKSPPLWCWAGTLLIHPLSFYLLTTLSVIMFSLHSFYCVFVSEKQVINEHFRHSFSLPCSL